MHLHIRKKHGEPINMRGAGSSCALPCAVGQAVSPGGQMQFKINQKKEEKH